MTHDCLSVFTDDLFILNQSWLKPQIYIVYLQINAKKCIFSLASFMLKYTFLFFLAASTLTLANITNDQ